MNKFGYTIDSEIVNRIRASIERDIDRVGWSCIAVADAPLPFIYTVGLRNFNRPDLLCVGLSVQMHSVMNILARKTIDGNMFDNDEIVDIGGKYPLKIIDAAMSVRHEYTIQAGQYYRTENYLVQQVIVPDKAGKFPGDDDCQEPWSELPVYYRSEEM